MKEEQYGQQQQVVSSTAQQPPANTQQTRVIYVKDARRRANGWRWGFGAFIVVLLLIVGAVWMMDITGTMDTIKETASANLQKLDHQQTQLTKFEQKLDSIQHQIGEIGTDIKNFFAQLMDKLNQG